MKRLILSLLAALALPTTVSADYVLPWNKVEPSYATKEAAEKACFQMIERLIKKPFYYELWETRREKYYDTEYLTKTEVLTTECRTHKTTDSNIGELRGWITWLEENYVNGELVKTPEVQEMMFTGSKEDFYFPLSY